MQMEELRKQWITSEKEYREGEVFVYRQKFTASQVKKAVFYGTALGVYEAELNGTKIGSQMFAPGFSYYPRRVLYQTHEVTELLREGENTLTVYLGQGWYCGRFLCENQTQIYGEQPAVAWILELEDAAGSRRIVSDETVEELESPYEYAGEYDGEIYFADGRENVTGHASAYTKEAPFALEPTLTEVRLQDEMPVREATVHGDVTILDFGQNFAGIVEIDPSFLKNETITIRHGEILNADGSLYTANLRKAKATIVYHAGAEKKKYRPRFTYMGFRYMELSGAAYQPGMIRAYALHTEMKRTGYFSCENPLVQKLYENQVWGQKSNYVEVPTDCPQRDERLGWLGDRATGAYGEAFIFNNAQLYNKWLQDIEDSMSPEGSISDVSPNYWTIYADDVTWPSAFFYVADMLYRQFGDDSAIRAHYPAMKRWMAHMEEATMKDYIMTKDQYGDWCMPPESQELIHSKDPARKTDGAILSTTVYYDLLNKMIGFARICGQDADISGYESLAAKIKAAYNAKFFNKETAEYGNNTVTANILSLRLGLVPEGYEGKVFSNIVKKTEEDFNGHVSTGVLGIQHLMRGLTEYGRVDMAYKILTNETYPSWGYMIKNGATTIWELWNGDTADPAMNSANHVMLLGDLLIWYYEDLAGIKCAPDAVGFKKLVMEPVFPDGLDEVSASYGSVYGEIKSAWTKKGGDFSWDITLPGNTSAIVRIPKKYNVTVGNLPGVRRVSATEGYMEVEIGSGSYHFGK